MAEELFIPQNSNKSEVYDSILPQIKGLISIETDLIANLSNTCAVLNQTFSHLWIGFYLVKGGELVLGPFQGPIACTRIKKGKGVCGTAWADAKTYVVDDVEAFPGHIACSSASKSEIVVPVIKDNQVVAVLDIDSDQIGTFDSEDQLYLEKLATYLASKWQ
ncbi:GAF domain-containing protein [Flammeovirga kamogawensis]|uniref:GAF domain-containing protein n=1 Tax=Flammeovirga kamogawensis TaxID=373891 RepID=A0ABX8GS39_9BACT|nr:GAF domain-containing protein [Flammeovirga kamogawensis]MBB6461498.1 GAF domain-containing protein [Flammeovirga kamogawensis]QWG06390.1 GAF domain-containing protein [Flammeovirga kamogawensis]TRX68219.1 GAF domain-containing protein [Flammeovirga kamogawensis]